MSVTKVEDVAFVRFTAPDLDEMRAFLEDFGLRCFEGDGRLYGCGSDGAPFLHVTELGDPRFAALGFRTSSRADLAALAEFDGVCVHTANAPGGGEVVHLLDPDGNMVEVVTGQSASAAEAQPPDPPVNSTSKRRRLGSAVRFPPGPSSVHRLGHVVLNVRNFAVSESWYKARFGLITSDQIEVVAGKPIGAFLRCDKGDTPTDHHTLFLLEASDGNPGFNHAAFEVSGFDDLMKGHTHLKSRNRQHAWGIGRHLLGSTIFDYWKDPWGHTLEHWTDGDLFSAADPPRIASIEELRGTLWGP